MIKFSVLPPVNQPHGDGDGDAKHPSFMASQDGVMLCWLVWHKPGGYMLTNFNIHPITPAQALTITDMAISLTTAMPG